MPEEQPFLGREARFAGRLTKNQLRGRRFARVHPDVYLPAGAAGTTLQQRIVAAWLWSRRNGIVAGSAAAALHGSRWVRPDVPIEVIHSNARSPEGVTVRRDVVLDGEVERLAEMAVTTPARTAFDLGRRGPLTEAVGRVDALLRATGMHTDAVSAVAAEHRHTRGLRQLEKVLSLADPAAESPRESWLRVVLVEAGLPRPHTQIPVLDAHGHAFAYLDMGWPDVMVAVEYDGEHHRTDRYHYVKDIRRREALEALGWIIVTVVAGDRAADIVRRVRAALARR